MHRPEPPVSISLEALGQDALDEFAGLLGGAGFGGCFCAVWTAFGPDWAARCQDPARPNLEETRRRVMRREHVGYLVRAEDELVAWTGAGPKTDFPGLATRLGSRRSEFVPQVWSIGCVAVRADLRGSGLSGRVVELVVAEARRNGARSVEAYPTRPWDEPRSYRGSRSTYERLGFVEVAGEPDGTSEILLMRRTLSG